MKHMDQNATGKDGEAGPYTPDLTAVRECYVVSRMRADASRSEAMDEFARWLASLCVETAGAPASRDSSVQKDIVEGNDRQGGCDE